MSIAQLVEMSKKKLLEARVSVTPSTAAWFGLSVDSRVPRVFHPWDVEQAAIRSAALAAAPVRRTPRARRGGEPQEILAQAFHLQ
jgi:hypothetical protein